MKKNGFRILVFVIVMLLTFTVVSAKAPQAALVIHNSTCWVPDGSGSLEFEDLWEIPDCCTVVETKSRTNAKIVACQAQLPAEAELPTELMQINYKNTPDFECWWDLAGEITTTKYLFTLTPTGRVNFHCVWVK